MFGLRYNLGFLSVVAVSTLLTVPAEARAQRMRVGAMSPRPMPRMPMFAQPHPMMMPGMPRIMPPTMMMPSPSMKSGAMMAATTRTMMTSPGSMAKKPAPMTTP